MVEIAFPTTVAPEACMRRGKGNACVNVCAATKALARGISKHARALGDVYLCASFVG